MFKKIYSKRNVQLFFGFLMGICFGFLLQRSGVTHYEIIMGQLLLKDWTVLKVMISAVVTGMIGIYLLKIPGLVRLHKKTGAFGSTVIGGLIFGVGFAVLGYCPGTMAGAVAQGSLDALLGGVVGMLLGTSFYAAVYDRLEQRVLHVGEFGKRTIPELLNMKPWPVIFIMSALLVGFLAVLEVFGL